MPDSRSRSGVAAALLALVALLASPRAAHAGEPRVVSVRRIWDASPHNAFTDLVRWHDRWWCVFRTGQAHVSPDGALQVLVSSDGEQWSPAARITSDRSDLRDAKVCVTPDDRLMLTGAGALHPPSSVKHESLAWFSSNGVDWSAPVVIGEPNLWLWRTTWHRGTAWSIGYDTLAEGFIRLYRSEDGVRFRVVVPALLDQQRPNEHAFSFASDDTATCVVRRDGEPGRAMLGRSRPPYTRWEWRELDRRLGGPALLRLPDGRLVAAGRGHDRGPVHTGLCWLDVEKATLDEFAKLPSGGDCSYPGLAWHAGQLWVSYYSSHEQRTSVYLARVAFDGGPGRP